MNAPSNNWYKKIIDKKMKISLIEENLINDSTTAENITFQFLKS